MVLIESDVTFNIKLTKLSIVVVRDKYLYQN